MLNVSLQDMKKAGKECSYGVSCCFTLFCMIKMMVERVGVLLVLRVWNSSDGGCDHQNGLPDNAQGEEGLEEFLD